MTIAFPRLMPNVGHMQHGFEPQRVDYLSPETGARLGGVTAGWSLWHLTVNLNNMLPDKADVWRAWVATQRGQQRRFFGYDSSRPLPRFHARGAPFTPRPAGWSQTIDAAGNAVVTLSGVLVGMVLSLTDYIGFEWDGWKRSLVRVVEPGVAGVDGTITVTVEPPIPTMTPAGAQANLLNPTCLMRLVSAGTQLGDQMYGGLYTAAGGKIEAIQDLVA